MASKVIDRFSPAHASEFSGLSMAMVNYLVRQKIITPTAGGRRGRGVQRKFSFGDIVVLKAVTKLLQGGVSVYRMRRALATFREIHPEITPASMPAAFLVTDGQEVFLRHKTGVLELLATRQFSFAFVIEVDSVRREAAEFAARNATQLMDRRSRRRKHLKSARTN